MGKEVHQILEVRLLKVMIIADILNMINNNIVYDRLELVSLAYFTKCMTMFKNQLCYSYNVCKQMIKTISKFALTLSSLDDVLNGGEIQLPEESEQASRSSIASCLEGTLSNGISTSKTTISIASGDNCVS